MTTPLWQCSASELLSLLAQGAVTAEELAAEFLQRTQRLNDSLNAVLHVHPQALEQAREVDRRRRAGEPLGVLAGLPVVVKDNLCTADMPTTCASRMLAQYRSPFDATVIERLRQAGAVLLGKTNLDEFAMGSSNETSHFGPVRNPWNPQRIPGGSSGGAAAAVAAGLAPLSLGSDTGGSIRLPAGLCGVVGLKPTYGRVSRWGLVAFASSLDQIGPLARTAQDCALLLEVIAGHDPRDSTSVPREVPAYRKLLDSPPVGLRIGYVPEHLEQAAPAVQEAVRQGLDVLVQELGARLVPIRMPHARYAVATYYIIAPSEASSNLARYDGVHFGYRAEEQAVLGQLRQEAEALRRAGDQKGLEELDSPLVRLYRATRSQGFGPEVKRRIMLGTYALSAGYYDQYYLKALKVRRLIRQDYLEAFQQVDLIAGPVSTTTAFALGEKQDPLEMYLVDLFTVGANLAGVPALSLPCGFDAEGLPVGMQLQGPLFAEDRLLQLAHHYQQHTSWHRQQPQLAGQA